uniref:5'-nucleotidase n=1 Tax=Ornithodoros kalahariensis TaxID=1580572 RepID=A7LH74_ORNKA|nr:5'-nucleotidase/putative apyrase isoform 2 precursor [Ornithodoros kalahariensis]
MLKHFFLAFSFLLAVSYAKPTKAPKAKCARKPKGDFTLTILHTNDIHSHFDESNQWGGPCVPKDGNTDHCVAGVTRLATLVKEMKERHPNALFMNAGDFFQGSVWYTVLKDRIVSAVMKELKYDAVSLGNHEFDEGPGGLAPFLGNMSEAGIKVIATNVDTQDEPLLKDKALLKSHTFCVRGRKVGVIGAVTEETRTIATPGKAVIKDVIPSLEEEAKKLKAEGVDIIIAITHTGYDVDPYIVEKVTDLDILVGGHTNTFLYKGEPPTKDKVEGEYPTVVERAGGSQGLIVQDFWFGKYLGFIQVTFDSKGNVKSWEGNPILVDHKYKEDESMKELLEPFRKIVNEAGMKPIGSSKVLLSADNKTCRLNECNMLNMVTDSFLAYYADQESPENMWSNVAAAVVNSGFARSSLPKSNSLTMFDIMRALPYESSLVVLTLKGTHLRKMFEHSVAQFTVTADPRGEFLAVSGMKVKYDLARAPNKRVVSLRILCTQCVVPRYEIVRRNETYRIATTSYIANGGDGFEFDEEVIRETKGVVDSEVYLPYIMKMSPLKTPVEGRVLIRNYPKPVIGSRYDMSWKQEIWV